MQKMRKILALLLSVIMCASLLVPAVSASGFSDVGNDHKYYEAINYLASMGIINGFEDGTFKPEESVTRAQYAKIMAYALGNSDIVATKQVFTDVATNHWAAGNIEAMVALGIINGMGDGTFAPESPVLYEQAVKMTVCALGYDLVAKNNGGYPDGYLKVATNRGFIKGISDGVIGQPANRGLVAQLIDNMLGIDKLDPITGEVSKGSSVKEDSGTESAKGQIVATYRNGLTPALSDVCKKNEIVIRENNGDNTYVIDALSDSLKENIASYLGKRVNINYKEDDDVDGNVITTLSETKGKNDTLTLDADDIYDYDNSMIEYYDEDSGDFEEARFASEYYVLYNGKAVDYTELTTLLAEVESGAGEVKLLSSNGDSEYDVLFIESYVTFIAGGTPTTSPTDDDFVIIYDKDNYSRKFTLPKESSSKETVNYTLNGVAAKYSSITAKSIVSVAQSKDGKVTNVLISTEKKSSSTITALSLDEKSISLDGKEYKMSESFVTFVQNNVGIVAVNIKGDFYIDAFGKIAYMETTAGNYTYGYVTAYEESSKGEDPLMLKIYAAGSGTTLTASTYAFKDTFYINNVRYKTSDEEDIQTAIELLTNAANAYDDGGYIKGTDREVETTNHGISQPVKFSLGGLTKAGNKAIDKLFIVESENIAKPELINTALVPATDENALSSLYQGTGSSRTLGSYYVNANTKIILVPEDKVDGKFNARTYSSLPNSTTYKYHVFDATASNIAGFVVIYATEETSTVPLSYANTPYIVSGTVKETLKDGETVDVIKLINAITGTEEEYYKGDETKVYTVKLQSSNYVQDQVISLDNLEIGDVVRFVEDGANELFDVEVVAQGASLTPYIRGIGTGSGSLAVSDMNAAYRTYIGTARLWDDNNLVVSPKFTDDPEFEVTATETWTLPGDVKYYVVDSSKSKAEDKLLESSKDECSKGDVWDYQLYAGDASKILAFSQSASNNVKFIIVYK